MSLFIPTQNIFKTFHLSQSIFGTNFHALITIFCRLAISVTAFIAEKNRCFYIQVHICGCQDGRQGGRQVIVAVFFKLNVFDVKVRKR